MSKFGETTKKDFVGLLVSNRHSTSSASRELGISVPLLTLTLLKI